MDIPKLTLVELDAGGGNRTHMGQAHTILSRARLPVPPLRLEKSIPENEILVNFFPVARGQC
jgi:hypothetical protein